MAAPIIIKEYSKKSLNDCDLKKLEHYLERKNLNKALKVTASGIEATSWVGVIKYKNLHFQILPKLIYKKEYKDDYDETARLETKSAVLKNLLYMLSYTKKLDIRTSEDTKLLKAENPFMEILIREYANSLFECLRRLTPKKYIREYDNLNYLKGKILFSENIKYNCVNGSKFYCEFDEFSENNILNRLFLFVSTCLFNISSDSKNKKILKLIMNYYFDIQLERFDKYKVGKIKLTRNQELFRKPFNLAKMFIEQTSVDLSKNKFENITLIWDMNKLFEEFIYQLIKKELPELNPIYQKGKKLFIGNYRSTYIDIFIKSKDGIVLDTKYKIIKNAKDFSNGDVFQVSTYCLLHGVNKAILLYPQYDDKYFNEEYFLNSEIEEKRYKIKFCTIDLQREDLKKQKQSLVYTIGKIIDFKNDKENLIS